MVMNEINTEQLKDILKIGICPKKQPKKEGPVNHQHHQQRHHQHHYNHYQKHDNHHLYITLILQSWKVVRQPVFTSLLSWTLLSVQSQVLVLQLYEFVNYVYTIHVYTCVILLLHLMIAICA